MSKKKTFRLIINTEWSMKTDRAQVFSRVYDHYGKRDFQDRCFSTLYAAFKPLSMALDGSSQAEVQREIRVTRDKLEMLLELANDLALPSSEVNAKPVALPQQPLEDSSVEVEQRPEEAATEESVYSQQEDNSLSLMEIFNSDD